jgi:hypothetical protein
MGTKAKFKVFSSRAFAGKSEATVTIDRHNLLVTVRPHRMHRTYEMRLEDLASIIVWRVAKAEIAEKKAARKKKHL